MTPMAAAAVRAAEAFVYGDVDVEGDLEAVTALGERLLDRFGASDVRTGSSSATSCSLQTSTCRNLSAFPMTDTELKLIAAAAITGESSSPKKGYSTPAAIGTPAAL
jgi:hypothetical protein